MDPQRPYPTEQDRWYSDGQYQDGHYTDGAYPERYADGGYPDENGAAGYTEPAYTEPGYAESSYTEPAYPEAGYAESSYPEPAYMSGSETSRRRRAGRPTRVGKRSSLEIPEPEGEPGAITTPPAAVGGEEQPRYRTEPLDRQALRRPAAEKPEADKPGFDGTAGAFPTVPTYQPMPAAAPPPAVPLQAPTQAIPAGALKAQAVYVAKRPGLKMLLLLMVIVGELLLLRVLAAGEFGHTVSPGGVLGGLFALAGLPLTGAGLYGLACGAGTTEPNVARAWSRTPLAYLPVGLLLLIAAGLAA